MIRIELPKQFEGNQLYLGDNLDVMNSLPISSVDLIYIDPPYFSMRDYSDESEIDEGDRREFTDTWNNLDEYLNFLKIRLSKMKILLKPSGNIFVHLDWHAVHYVKIIMDRLFGYDNFRNEIIWCYSGANVTTSCFPKKHDTILWYSRSDKYTFNPKDILVEKKSGEDHYKEDADGNKYIMKYGKKYVVKYDFLLERKIPEDWWYIPFVSPSSKERVGYPTQKPELLLERIIKACSNNGDIVADFFGGSGTTFVVSQVLGRKWIGCDKSEKSIEVIKARLFGNKSVKDKDKRHQGDIESSWCSVK